MAKKAPVVPIKDTDHAIAYAAQKCLEGFLKGQMLSFGQTFDVSGHSITLKFAPGTTVSRDAGLKGDGKILKKATQDLYGYSLWALMVERLRKFNQWEAIKTVLIDAMKEMRRRKSLGLEDAVVEIDPELEKAIEDLKAEIPIPDRKENTARDFDKKLDPTITIN